jgi:hypothetical protein
MADSATAMTAAATAMTAVVTITAADMAGDMMRPPSP